MNTAYHAGIHMQLVYGTHKKQIVQLCRAVATQQSIWHPILHLHLERLDWNRRQAVTTTYLLLGGNGEVEHDGLGGPVEPEGAPPGEGTSNVMGLLGETSRGLSRRPPLLLTEGTYLGDDTAIGRLWGPLPPSTASKNSCNRIAKNLRILSKLKKTKQYGKSN